ncbi:terminase large subunit domain-containing protein [uncultured Methanobrevibacter sp.]|uniref:terminase large subunit domain-containing protein n=2 Tax=uncultured Methanobrevibacter sp. TaxID=253161 RepID=UPI0025CFEA92|nr:terminase family protein [uncultured Methanobrevibacter sp.]
MQASNQSGMKQNIMDISQWKFLTFGYLRNINDLDTYQGSEYQFIGIDELTQLERFKYIYMRSRVMKTKDNKLPTQVI